MSRESTVLQVIPHMPGSRDGVGDNALVLARRLASDHQITTIFAVAAASEAGERDGFRIFPLKSAASVDCDHVILHYVNYGYQARGVPFALRDFARELRDRLSGRWVTTFHEIYASGPPWRSAFWLRPLQVRIARQLIDLSNSCVVSNEVIRREIARHDSGKKVYFVPVMSNFGELALPILTAKSPHHWAICGGTELIVRSLRALPRIAKQIPAHYFPTEMEVIGGTASEQIRNVLQSTKASMPGVSFRHSPEVSVATASALLAGCAFGWLDYFGRGRAWPGMIFKSSSFAALCAHGVVPVFSHEEGTLSAGRDALPGPYFRTETAARFPDEGHLGQTQRALSEWYFRNASSTHAAAIYAEALQ